MGIWKTALRRRRCTVGSKVTQGRGADLRTKPSDSTSGVGTRPAAPPLRYTNINLPRASTITDKKVELSTDWLTTLQVLSLPVWSMCRSKQINKYWITGLIGEDEIRASWLNYQSSAEFFCKGPESKDSQLCRWGTISPRCDPSSSSWWWKAVIDSTWTSGPGCSPENHIYKHRLVS